MATAAAPAREAKDVKVYTFYWEGKDKTGKIVKGEMRASGEAIVNSTLRRQGIQNLKVKKVAGRRGKKITSQDITFFTRQLATMMKAGVPLLQAFDIVAKGHSNPSVTKLLIDIKSEVETGSSLAQSFRKYPLYFDSLYCNLVGAGEQAGILDTLLDRLATYQEKILAIKGKIKKALFYPVSILVVAFVVVAIIMIFVIPQFKSLFDGFGAALPAPTLFVMQLSNILVHHLWCARRRRMAVLQYLAAKRKNAVLHGPYFAKDPRGWRRVAKGHHRTLDAYALHHVCRWCAAG
jgi:type IV pilus assembly protein PilC